MLSKVIFPALSVQGVHIMSQYMFWWNFPFWRIYRIMQSNYLKGLRDSCVSVLFHKDLWRDRQKVGGTPPTRQTRNSLRCWSLPQGIFFSTGMSSPWWNDQLQWGGQTKQIRIYICDHQIHKYIQRQWFITWAEDLGKKCQIRKTFPFDLIGKNSWEWWGKDNLHDL